jgi:hypothetical protein
MSQQDPQYKLDTLNEDWLRTRTWDLFAGDQLVKTLDQLVYVLGVKGAPVEVQKTEVRDFTALPAWGPAPAALKAQVLAWLAT